MDQAHDFSDLHENGGPRWVELMAALDAGKLCRVSEDTYWYFLEVLPPRQMGRNGFVFCEGEDEPTVFTKNGPHYHAQRTTWADLRARRAV